jgi:hypothetical protein
MGILKCCNYMLFQRAAATFFAIALRFLGESLAALAFPPLAPPSLPSATAAGFLPAFGSSKGVPSTRSPIACSMTRKALTAKSLSVLERPGMILL